MNVDTYIKLVRSQCDNYEQTIQVIICFDAAVRFDDTTRKYFNGSFFLPGRKLLKQPTDSKDFVTPDVVCQLSPSYGIVGEVKFSASSPKDFGDAFDHVVKYDQNLYGWKTPDETIQGHDISLLVNDLHKNTALSALGTRSYTRNLTLVACAQQRYATEVVKIEKFHGSFSDAGLEKKMANAVPVPLEPLFGTISSVKFYDAEPPCAEYTMNVLWMSVFNELASQEGRTGSKREIVVRVDDVTDMLRTRFAFHQEDGRQPESPKTSWVRSALDCFVRIGFAFKKGGSEYVVTYSPYRRKASLIDVFARKVFETNKNGGKQPKAHQPDLPGFVENPEAPQDSTSNVPAKP